MAEIRLITAFGTVPADAQEGIRGVVEATIAEIAREEGSFQRAKAVFTESDEQCVFTVELDGTRREPLPLVLDLERVEEAVVDSTAQAGLKEDMRAYFRRVLGR